MTRAGAWASLVKATQRATLCTALLLAAASAAYAQSRPTESGATVTGQVVEGVSGLGLSDVRVQVQGRPDSVLTDSRGQFTLRDIPPGAHVLRLSPRPAPREDIARTHGRATMLL